MKGKIFDMTEKTDNTFEDDPNRLKKLLKNTGNYIIPIGIGTILLFAGYVLLIIGGIIYLNIESSNLGSTLLTTGTITIVIGLILWFISMIKYMNFLENKPRTKIDG